MASRMSAKKPKASRLYRVFDRMNRELFPHVWALSTAQAAGFYAATILGDPNRRWELSAEEITQQELVFIAEFEDACPGCGYCDRYPRQAQISCPNCAP